MFYSRLLLSKKGSLRFVWIAAHCPKRLKKDQVRKTDISSSVDKILADEVPIVTHRILAYLLLGVVRIYSMKIEYLFHDCNDVLSKLCEFNIGKRTRPGIGVSRKNCHSIILPKKFELDEFDLEILEDQDIMGGNTGSCEDVVVLAGEQIKVGDALGLLYKENLSFPETHSVTYTPPKDVLLPPHMDNDDDFLINSSRDNGDFVTSFEKLRGTNFIAEDWPSPTVLNGSEIEQMHHRLPSESPRISFQWLSHEMKYDSIASTSRNRSDVPCMEILQQNRFSLEDRLDPLVLDEVEERQIHFRSYNKDLRTNFQEQIHYSGCAMIARPSHKKLGIEEEHVEHSRIELNLHVDEPCALTRSIDIGQLVEAEKKKFVEVITPEIRKCQRNQGHMKPVTVDMTPNSKRPGVEVATVHTPAPKEHAKILKKRKVLLDLTTALPSKVLKSWIDDPNDIVHKRRKVPHTLLRSWRANKLSHIPRCFLDPMIHSIPIDLGPIHHKVYDTYTAPIADVVSEDYVNSTSTIGIQEQIQDERSPLTPMSREQTPIAPGTPIAHFNSLRSHENRAIADPDILEPTSSHESFEQQPLEFIIVFPDEEMNSYEGECLENDVYSARTRAVGIFLYKNFLYKKRREEEDEVLNLTHLLRGKAKKNTARLFYEILVLKTLECINVRQDKAYNDIMLQEVTGLKRIAEINVHTTRSKLDYIRIDLWGPTKTPSHAGAMYRLTIVDDYSRKLWVYPLVSKDHTFKKSSRNRRHSLKLNRGGGSRP